MSISIVIPAYNEQRNLQPLLSEILAAMRRAKVKDYEIIFVDDGSQDGTLDELKRLTKKYPQVTYLSFSRNFGHQAALRAGIANAQGEAVISMDADLQHPPRLLPEIISRWRDGYDIVYTRRQSGRETNIFKRWSSQLFYFLLNRLSGLDIDQGAADFRLIDARVATVIKDMVEPNLFLRGFISWCGFKVSAIDYQPDSRFAGESKYSFRKMMSLALHGVTQFSVQPLRLASILGVLFALAGLVYGIYAVYAYFVLHDAISGWTSMVVSVLIMGGIQLIILGIIGEYLGKTFIQTKQRPDYIIRERGAKE